MSNQLRYSMTAYEAVDQFTFVDITGRQAGDGESTVLGVTQNAAIGGELVEITTDGVSRVKVASGASGFAGDALKSSSDGEVEAAEMGDQAVGIAMSSYSGGDTILMKLISYEL